MISILSIDEKDLPEIKKWKVGGGYHLTLDVRQLSTTKADEGEGMRARFKVNKVAAHQTSMEDKLARMQDKAKQM